MATLRLLQPSLFEVCAKTAVAADHAAVCHLRRKYKGLSSASGSRLSRHARALLVQPCAHDVLQAALAEARAAEVRRLQARLRLRLVAHLWAAAARRASGDRAALRLAAVRLGAPLPRRQQRAVSDGHWLGPPPGLGPRQVGLPLQRFHACGLRAGFSIGTMNPRQSLGNPFWKFLVPSFCGIASQLAVSFSCSVGSFAGGACGLPARRRQGPVAARGHLISFGARPRSGKPGSAGAAVQAGAGR